MQMLRKRRFWLFIALSEFIVLIIVSWGLIVTRQEVVRYEGNYDAMLGNQVTVLFKAAHDNVKLIERLVAGETLPIEEMRTLREGTLTFSKSYSDLHGLVIQRSGKPSEKFSMEPAVIAYTMTQYLDNKVLLPDTDTFQIKGLEKQIQVMHDIHKQWIDALGGGKSVPDPQQWREITEELSIGTKDRSLELESIFFR
ncbi:MULTISPECIES: hypothetical protein [unclassified Paenibacillus]|uniref:hypothetical protein n=1 Tax=unclassified Paenibacillus TaxID=185978 RepID=UPI002785CD62|nr:MULTISPECIES: hypothetical protein [unclassified Paenibacillus]MDQ0899381.1 hypothetical protein [Paenibacillus sp. V4I7]MDQ0914558.1 hypothetical protein [Paenibacillus sp. V4I5]